MYISFTKNVLTFSGVSGVVPALNGYLADVDTATSTVHFVWDKTTTANLSGIIFYLNFVYNGATSSPLHFLPTCDIETGLLPPTRIYPTWTDGAVNPKTNNAQTATIGGILTASTGSPVTVPLMFGGFGAYGSNVGSITQKIHYDVTKLSFAGITTSGNLSGAMAYASNGLITITWTSTTGKNIDFPANQLNLIFGYNGITATTLEFYPYCIITTNLGVNIPVSYVNGTISPGPSVGTAVLGNVTGALQGHDYLVPLTLATLPGVSSMTLNIIYDNPRLSFIKDTNEMKPGSTVVNAHGDTISILYTNGSSLPINGIFLNLKFHYGGIGVANVMFGPGCLFTDNSFNPVQTAYTNATITPAIVTPNANIEYVETTPGSDILVPIDFSLLPTNIGAVTMNILFDQSKLNFVDAIGANNPFGATVWSPSAGKVNVTWASVTATNINGTFLKLRFHYLGGGAASVAFTDGCEVANIAAVIVPVNWINGGVNIHFKLSGFLTYDSSPNPVLALGGVTVYLKDIAEPLPPAIGPIPTILYTTTTDVTGYFEFFVPNGTYYIYAASSAAWAGADGADVTNIRRYIALLSNSIDSDVLRQHAADVNQDGNIDGSDVTVLRRRIANLTPNPNYLAPDWLFENPGVTISAADATQNFMGTCSGDVNGSYPF